ncbi:FAD:protein FMN transferase [Thalassotalea fonticola]|uniref:FAD:protein FMN transferase n=1 Tax=Thalassotalea fonticola TaxID=3065649 RepID=A0ABZ0GQ97_9GAMM|nr:FAD:protein FMN transferase [Colwelliaceae bacterium S1-1]
MKNKRKVTLYSTEFGYKAVFNAMASPCEVLINSTDKYIAKKVAHAVATEAWRIEDKYSRYLDTSVCSKINASNGDVVAIDGETLKLLEFAKQCYNISNGLFDITSGVLRNAWKFDGSVNVPEKNQIAPLLSKVGFDKILLLANSITLQPGMEIDLGGIGKEYAVDTSLLIAKKLTDIPVLINFGGDISVSGKQYTDQPWHIGIDPPDFENKQPLMVSINGGSIATSGDARRYLLKNGQRYSHILNPKTGFPLLNAPKSITVAAPNCIQAGFIATLALLQGEYAENFLKKQDIGHWCIW